MDGTILIDYPASRDRLSLAVPAQPGAPSALGGLIRIFSLITLNRQSFLF